MVEQTEGMIGKIQRVKLREVWRHEAHDFTTWLEENIDVLNDALDLSLAIVEREGSVGSFSVDLVAENDSGGRIVIENQLEQSDHDHLGKLLTYLTGLDANTAIWIVATPRPEHVRTVSWLNESSSASFYLVKVEAIRIGDSKPAPLFTLITGPSEEAKGAGTTKKELAARDIERKRFWTGLLMEAKRKTKLHANLSPGAFHYVPSSAGLPSGLSLNYVVRMHNTSVELYIDRQDDGDWNKQALDRLKENREEIERAFGGELEWDWQEGRRGCRIRKAIESGGWRDEETWPTVHQQMVDAMIRLEAALRPHLGSIE